MPRKRKQPVADGAAYDKRNAPRYEPQRPSSLAQQIRAEHALVEYARQHGGDGDGTEVLALAHEVRRTYEEGKAGAQTL